MLFISVENTPGAVKRTYLEAEAREIPNWRDITNAGPMHPSDASGNIDFLFEGQTINLL